MKESDNKEMQLLTGIGKLMVKYMDYFALLFLFPVIFDVKMFDTKIFIALATLIVIKAIMPTAHYILGIDKKMVVHGEGRGTTSAVKVSEPDTDIKHRAIIDATNTQRNMIRFDGKPFGEKAIQINTKKVDEDFVIISFPDFRTLRVHKNEMQQLYIALLESEYGFFNPGKWYLEIKVISQLKDEG